MNIVFYITGHGFGHATRAIEVMNAIARRRPDARLFVRTLVPRWMFDVGAEAPVVREEVETDTGVAQIDSLRLDEAETARRAARFHAGFDARVAREAAALRALGASAVIGDVPPLAFAAAAAAGVPSAALGNFTWDWIYAAYPEFETIAPGVLARIGAAYAQATLGLRLPLHGGFGSIEPRVRDVPFIARHATHRRDETRRRLELGDRPVVLASFGGHDLALPYDEVARRSRYTIVATDHEAARRRSGEGSDLRLFTSAELAARGLRYPDLVAASDVVVSKAGYGIVSECIANGASLLYTDRGRFAEQDVFVAEMPRVLRCRAIPQDDLLAGRWDDAIERLLNAPQPPERPATNGAEIAAAAILELAASP